MNNSNRRNFLKKAAITAPGVALLGASKGIPVTGNFIDQDKPNTDHQFDNGWLNVSDYGASGSKFETTATTNSGSKQITVANVGDFKVGQGVMVSKCNIRYTPIQMWSTGIPYVSDRRPVENSFEVRGYDGTSGSWVIYILDIAPSSNPAFRWSDDLGRTWHPEVPVSHDWQPLAGGVEVKFNRKDWEAGYVVSFGVRDQLISKIEKIEGNVLTLQDEANRTVNDAVVRHNDTLALQEAVDRAIREKLNVHVPVGHYMLAKTIRVRNAKAITIEGASSADTVLDISEGEGPCFTLDEGTEVNIRNFRMIGFMGFNERDMAGYISTRGARYIWGFGLKHCKGISIRNTERVLVENCHATRMSGEVFSSGGRGRGTVKPGQSFTQGITYLRCSVTDCARNAFDDVIGQVESTSVLNSRIVDVGGHSWEACVRFGKFIGNYVRNSGGILTGNFKTSKQLADTTYPDLGAGQNIIADNVFEGSVPYGGCAVSSSGGASQVIIRNNLFINFESPAIEASSVVDSSQYPSSNTIITGNIIDMTAVGQKSVPRTAINISANDTIVSDNQIYVRGSVDPVVKAIRLSEPALNVIVHDNLIRNCGVGIVSDRSLLSVVKVDDDRNFLLMIRPSELPVERINPEVYNGSLYGAAVLILTTKS